LAERKNMLATFAREASLQEAGGPFGDNDLLVRRDVVAVGMRNESERFWLPGVEPDVFVRQVNPAFVLHPNHAGKLAAAWLGCERLRLEEG
jgi:hypothetical protein